MRRSVTWALWGSLLLSAVALLLPQGEGQVLTATSGVAAVSPVAQTLQAEHTGAVTSPPPPMPLPARLPDVILEPARRDIFSVPSQAPAPSPVPAPVMAQLAPITSSAPPPAPPQMTYRFGGRFETPEGRLLTYLAKGDNVIEVGPGQALEDGWLVEAVSPDTILLVYPALKAQATIAIAPAQLQ